MAKAFLFGAGATRAQYKDAPLSSDFFLKLAKHGGNYFNHINSVLQTYLKGPLRDQNVEEIMIMSETLPLSAQNSFLESLYSSIHDLLVSQTESDRNSIVDSINGTFRRPQTRFKTLLLDPRLNENDFFVTLNYDLYIDREVLSNQKEIDYGIDNNFLEGSPEIKLSKKKCFSVYHLHGSLNWEDINGKIAIRQGPIQPHHTRTGINICLVPPGKKEISPAVKSVWKIAKRRILKAEELIIVGCSLNPKDVELIRLIKDFSDRKGADKVKIIYEGDPVDFRHLANREITDNYSFIGNNIRRYPFGFCLNCIDPNVMGAIEFILSPLN